MTLLIELLGSIALLLWGLRMVRTGVMRSYGNSLKRLARRSEGKVLPAFTSGLLVAALLQSSTAAILISVAPLLIAFLIFQKQFVQSFMQAGIK